MTNAERVGRVWVVPLSTMPPTVLEWLVMSPRVLVGEHDYCVPVLAVPGGRKFRPALAALWDTLEAARDEGCEWVLLEGAR